MILIKKGDLVISGINVEKGALTVYEGEENILATIHYSSYIFDTSKIDIDFLKVFLRSPDFVQLLKEQVPGGIKTEIKPKHILPLEVYFPETTTEQKIIAEHFFEKEAKFNQLDEHIFYQLTQLENLNQAILQEAVQGKLVKQDPKDEPASELLKRIKAEKESLIKAKKLKSGKSTDQSVSYTDEYEIPKSWTWCKTDDIFFVTKLAGFEYTEHIKLQEFGEIPVVRAQNVRPLEIDKTNLLYIDREVSQLLDRCSLTKKCLLVTFIGAGIGDVATFNESNRWHLAPNVAKMEPFEGCEEMIDVSYVNYFLMSKIGQRELFKHIKATAQPSLSMGTIRDIDVPLPPLSEQKRIVAEIEKQFAKTKQLKEHIIANQQATEQLLKALLHQAFEVWETETIE
jgi:type I restriction enzyme S subunit